MTEALFSLPSDAYAVTSDDCYTPKLVFDAMGLTFDIDVAAPYGGPWHVPAKSYYTAEDDGLAQPWHGIVWCNPPYSKMTDWVHAWAGHDRGCLMGMVWPNKWFARVLDAADAVTFAAVEFIRPDGKALALRQQVFVAFRGVGSEPAERLAAADPYGAVLYGKPAS
jgi:hypothetical protein